MQKKGNIEVHTGNIFPIIKKWLYSDKDIFLRELISNACDAISKLRVLQNIGQAQPSDVPFAVNVKVDKETKTISVIDNGIGMTAEEVEKYINQVAFSGAEDFIAKYKDKNEDNQIIGHFGLGFYSAFMVADKVVIETKSCTGTDAVCWECQGGTEFELSDGTREETGTAITLHIGSDSEDFCEPERLRSILLKYCSFLPYPIYLSGEEHPVNTLEPLWNKSPSECTDEEYISFYHKTFSDFNDPLFWIHLNVEYPFNLRGILYFPKLTHEFESAGGQIKLYNNQVFVADNIKEVTPEFLMLLKGVIDCPDLPLNVSRSFLQNDGYTTKVSSYITRKVADRLTALQSNDRDKFNGFWSDISPFIEYGALSNDDFYQKVKDILQTKTINGEYVTLKEFAEKNDKKIVYVTNEAAQANYISILKENGKDAAIMPHLIDVHFISFIESKTDWHFTRIDAELDDASVDEDLAKLWDDIVDKENVEIKVSSIKTDLPAIITQNEQQRRMTDSMKLFAGMGSMNAFPSKYTLVLNKDSAVIQNIADCQDIEKQKLICRQVYDLARIAHGSISNEDMLAFTKNSATLLEKFLY